MHALNVTTLLLIIVGGVNWLLVGLFQFDLVAALFGGQQAVLSRIVYILVGLSAVWVLVWRFVPQHPERHGNTTADTRPRT
jgi:uncharacterized protein